MDFKKLEQLMDMMPDRGIPGCELIVTKNGETVFHRCVGFSDAAKTRPASGSDLYWIFSASKVITCTAAMRLVEQGIIRLDDPVYNYLPAYAHMKIRNHDGSITDAKNVMKVEHLFTMSSGLDYSSSSSVMQEAIAQGLGTIALMNEKAKDPLLFEPGTHYQYSLSHDVLGAVVEVASGRKFSEYLRTEIFDPLGMKEIGFHPTADQIIRFTDYYSYRNSLNQAIPTFKRNGFRYTESFEGGGAGIYCTVSEYIKLLNVLANGGNTANGYRLLMSDTISQMGVNRLNEEARNDFFKDRLYGYGWGYCGRAHMNPKISLARSSVGEFGWDGAAGAYALVDPSKRIAIFFDTAIFGCNYLYNFLHGVIRDTAYRCIGE